MGPIPYAGGSAFRVWAPNASSVRVAGSFNAWSATATPLASEGNGNWSADVAGVPLGAEYRYVITNGANTAWKNDPRSQHVTNSVGNSKVADTSFNWDWTNPTTTLFTDGFEATTLNAAWTRSGTGNFSAARNTTYRAAGLAGYALASSVTNSFATAQLTLNVNATNFQNLSLVYKVRNVGEETHTQDGVFISANGTTWTKVDSLPAISSAFSTRTVNISSAAAAAGITPAANFRIRFQRFDDWTLPSDGVAFDDVSLTGNTVTSGNFTTPAWNDMVIYQAHIGTLNDSPGGSPGNFVSATARLDFIAAQGYNVVQLLPINEFGADFSWGYNPAYPFSVEAIYGGYNAYKQFIKEAHKRGLAVFQDVVYNHFGPSDLDMWQYDGWSQNGKGGIYFYNDWRSSTPWGDTRPDYGRNEVRSFLRDNAMMYLQDYRVDGLRWDSTVNIRTQNNGGGGDIGDGWTLMQYINNEINATQGWKISIAEDLQNNDFITKTTGAGGAGFDSQWDAAFVHPIRDNLIVGSDSSRNMNAVAAAIGKKDNGNAFSRTIYTESHDEVANGKSRVPEMIWPGNHSSWASKKRSTMGGALVLTAPGIPMLFQGQDILESGFFADTDPLDWSYATSYSGITDMYRRMIQLRRNWDNNTRGLRGQGINVHHVNNTGKVVAFHRFDVGGAGDDVIVVANFSGTGYSSYNLGFPRGGTWFVRFNSDWNGYSSDFGNWNAYNTTANGGAKDGMGFNANVGVGPYTVIILSQ